MSKVIIKIGKSSDGKEMHYSAGIIVECNGKYLMMDRKNFPFGFAAPAGHVDEGETPKEAAKRETLEETGIKLENLEFVHGEEVPWNICASGAMHHWYVYKAKVPSEDFVFNDKEAKSMDWYNKEEIKNLDLEPIWKYWFEKFKIINENNELWKPDIR